MSRSSSDRSIDEIIERVRKHAASLDLPQQDDEYEVRFFNLAPPSDGIAPEHARETPFFRLLRSIYYFLRRMPGYRFIRPAVDAVKVAFPWQWRYRGAGLPKVSELLCEPDATFIDTVYLRVIGRLPDEAGKAYYEHALTAGSMTRLDVIASLAASDEAKDTGIRVRGLKPKLLMRRMRRLVGGGR